MLRIGILQVPQQDLTAFGSRFLQALEEDLVRQERALQLGTEMISDTNRSHARTWCRANPDYVQCLRWPEGVGKLIG